MAALHVIVPGMLTTIQDRGRWGRQSRGVPVAGPMDPMSHRVANALVGNEREAALLEVTLVGPEVEFEDERIVAVAGAEFEMWLNDQSVAADMAFVAPARSRLRFGRRRRGARAYLAVAGSIAVPPVFGSRSTHVATAMGGIDGRPLRAGDRLPLGEWKKGWRPPFSASTVSNKRYEPFSGVARVRVLPGPQRERFTSDALDILQSAPYVVGASSNRMGFRLEGPALTLADTTDMISDAMPLGALQVPPGGQPILLMADRQTTGGYPCLATAITADIGVAGQLAPGDSVFFIVSSRAEALAALILQERALMARGDERR